MKFPSLLLVLALISVASAEVVVVNVVGEGSPQQLAQAVASAVGDPVTLRLIFEDGQVLEVSGSKADAQLFLSGGIDELEYLGRLETTPITRGPLVVPGLCEPAKGESCESAGECGCYETQTCQPSSSSADFRGCVEETPPENAHLEDSEYVCDAGFVWNGDLSDCVPPIVCPEGQAEVDGVCYAGGVEESSDGGICLLFFGFILLSAPFLLLGGLVLVVVAYLVLKKKK